MTTSSSTPAPAASPRPAADQPVRVLFVGGMPRSGSTLVDLMLGQLPRHCDVGELFYMWQAGPLRNQVCACGRLFRDCEFWTAVGAAAFGGWDAVDPREVMALQQRTDTTGKLPLALAGGLLGNHEAAVRRYLNLTVAVYRAIAAVSGAEVVVDSTKRPSTAHLLARDERIDLRLVHVVRDPRGVVNSWSHEVALPQNAGARDHLKKRGQGQITRRWLTVNLMIERLSARGVGTVRVRYEDLVRDPETPMREVMALWGDAGGPEDLSFLTPEGLTTGVSHAVAGGRVRLQIGPLPLRLDEAWRRELPAFRQRAAMTVTWPLARRYGYR
jgi:Sulfotransferase family